MEPDDILKDFTEITSEQDIVGGYYNSNIYPYLIVQDYMIYNIRRVGGNISKSLVNIEFDYDGKYYKPMALVPDWTNKDPYSKEMNRIPVAAILQKIMGNDFSTVKYKNTYQRMYNKLHNHEQFNREDIHIEKYGDGSAFIFKFKNYSHLFVVKEQGQPVLYKSDHGHLVKLRLINQRERFYYTECNDNCYHKIYEEDLGYLVQYNQQLTDKLVNSEKYKGVKDENK